MQCKRWSGSTQEQVYAQSANCPRTCVTGAAGTACLATVGGKWQASRVLLRLPAAEIAGLAVARSVRAVDSVGDGKTAASVRGTTLEACLREMPRVACQGGEQQEQRC
jgi:hypothetical protein